uniref:Uncharacterized protein n=1 Tax=Pyrodinium bahamense TaxID=73915 RepID=A0A7S0AAZ0_9DINO|mmetsp:Transcript_29525/g.81107  ORF Transcript_29525/g.81107 Transcript_29525/m.81107 type:complete len:734 (+) Transcript_29525:74-2275(+)
MATKRASTIGVWFFVRACFGDYAQEYVGQAEHQHAQDQEQQLEGYSRYERQHAGEHEQRYAGKDAEDYDAAYRKMYEGKYADQGRDYESQYAGKYEGQYGGNYSKYESQYHASNLAAEGQADKEHAQVVVVSLAVTEDRQQQPERYSKYEKQHAGKDEQQYAGEHAKDYAAYRKMYEKQYADQGREYESRYAGKYEHKYGENYSKYESQYHASNLAAEGQPAKEHAQDAVVNLAMTADRQQQPEGYSKYELQHAGEHEQRYDGEYAEDYHTYRKMYEGQYSDQGRKYESRYAGKYERRYGDNYNNYERRYADGQARGAYKYERQYAGGQASGAAPRHPQESAGPEMLAASDPVHAAHPAAEVHTGKDHVVDQSPMYQTAKAQIGEQASKDASGKERATEHHAEEAADQPRAAKSGKGRASERRAEERPAEEPGAAALAAQREACNRAEARIAELERWRAELDPRVRNESRALDVAHSIVAKVHAAFRARREHLQQLFNAKLQAVNPTAHEVEDAVRAASEAVEAMRRLGREEGGAARAALRRLRRARGADLAKVRSLWQEASEAARQAKRSGLAAARAERKAALEERVYERTVLRSEEVSERLEARAEEVAERNEVLLERQFVMVEGVLEYLTDELEDANEVEDETRVRRLRQAERRVMQARAAALTVGGGARSRDSKGGAMAFLARTSARSPSSSLGVPLCLAAMGALVTFAGGRRFLRGGRTIALEHTSLG